jgi:cysteinyl-tRNA synthetase
MPEIICKATDNIKEMIEYVQELVKNGYTYETSTAIYFDVEKLDKYGVLSGINLNEQKAGARVEVDLEKKNPYDFALWIKAPENHLMKWDSPWGLCYPGWHIECSAMGRKYLGEKFDIHTGGVDLIPTHHENEIAQSKGCTGEIPANYWMHGEFLLINGGKMSKSLNNAYLVQDIVDKGYSALVYKMLCFTTHYRNKLNFTWEAIEAANTALGRLKEGYIKHKNGSSSVSKEEINKYKNGFMQAINDDLNIPMAMSIVWDVVKNNEKSKEFAELLLEFDKVLGLNIDKTDLKEDIPDEIVQLAEKRLIVRQNKDWAESDKLRDEILKNGYTIKDTKDTYTIEKI